MQKETIGYNSTAALYWSALFTPLFGALLLKCSLLYNHEEEKAESITRWMIAFILYYAVWAFAISKGPMISVLILYLAPNFIWAFVSQTYRFEVEKRRFITIPVLIASVVMLMIVGCVLCFKSVNPIPQIDCSTPKTLENSKIAVLGYLFKTRIMPHTDRYKDTTADFTRSYKALMDSQCWIIREFLDVHKPELKKYDGRDANEIAAYADYMTRR